jgi:hypothetical protein
MTVAKAQGNAADAYVEDETPVA